MSNSYSDKAHPSSIYTRFDTRYVIPLFSHTDPLFEWSQMKIIKLEFQYFGTKLFFCLKQVYCCLTFVCVYIHPCNSDANVNIGIYSRHDKIEPIVSCICTALCFILKYIYTCQIAKQHRSPMFAFNMQNMTKHSTWSRDDPGLP